MSQSTREERGERRRAFIAYLEKAFGYKPTSNGGDTNAFCKDLYELGQVEAPERHANTKPRSAPLLEHLTGKFKARGFAWRREATGAITYDNVPRVGGRQLSLYEMLVVPIELCDPLEPATTMPTAKAADREPKRVDNRPHVASRRRSEDEVGGGWGASFS